MAIDSDWMPFRISILLLVAVPSLMHRRGNVVPVSATTAAAAAGVASSYQSLSNSDRTRKDSLSKSVQRIYRMGLSVSRSAKQSSNSKVFIRIMHLINDSEPFV